MNANATITCSISASPRFRKGFAFLRGNRLPLWWLLQYHSTKGNVRANGRFPSFSYMRSLPPQRESGLLSHVRSVQSITSMPTWRSSVIVLYALVPISPAPQSRES